MMLRYVLLMTVALWMMASVARGAAPELADFKACRDKPIVCYQYVAEIRTTQLESERERLFVERERALLTDWQAHREHRLHALWGQYWLTWILLVIGVVVVVSGLVMSWMHMMHGFRGGVAAENALEAGKDGVKLSSPVIGLFVFGASIWFFNIYIDKVYQLSVLPSEIGATGQTTANKTDNITNGSSASKASTAIARGTKPETYDDAKPVQSSP
jgi:hypothetical protein